MTLKDCVRHPYPTLGDIAESHGAECALLSIEVFTTNLNDNLNIQRMDEDQTKELAELLYEESPDLKLTELHEFFRRVKSACYGEYYGSLDCVKIMSDFQQFLSDRMEAARKLHWEREKDWEREWEAENKKACQEGRVLLQTEFYDRKRAEILK